MTEQTGPNQEIDAGAILPGTEQPTEYDRDLISARHYQHPGLDERTVVRLVPKSLGVADELTMAYLGFDDPTRTSDVGIGRRQALGFPAWALINDPGNAHHALNLVRELERLARQAKSSPGAAKDGLMALASQLDRSAPHFLPTFYEQAGRIYLDTGSTSYAATMFGKAREAEEAHNLAVDVQRQRAVFLEFAFAGALTAKALSAYAKSLAAKHGAQEAYALFLTLCVERTKGGLAPYGGMAEDLRRLAKAAHRSLVEEDTALLRAVLDTSAIARAGARFWNAYHAPLVALARADPAVRYRLLSFVPVATDCHALWLEILRESGAVDALVLPAERAEPTPNGPAGWLTMFAAAHQNRWRITRLPALLGLTAAMAGRLKADGVPVGVFPRFGVSDIDLLDLCLAEGIPLPQPPHRLRLDVADWRQDQTEGARDLVALAAHPTLRKALADSLLRILSATWPGTQQKFQPLREVPGLRLALEGWLADMADRVTTAGLARIERCAQQLSMVAIPFAYVNIPEVARRIAATDMVGALTTALRGGIFDELSWPALEEATRLLVGDDEQEPGKGSQVTLAGEGWPALVLARGERHVVVGPDGVLLDHILRIPQDARRRDGFYVRSTYVDGRLLVRWPGPEHSMAYWSDAPDQVFALDTGYRSYSDARATPSIPLPGGGAFTGGRALHPGDGVVPVVCDVMSDGTTYWAWYPLPRGPVHNWREVDVATGDIGRLSLPSFVEDFAVDGATLRPRLCDLRPAAPGTLASPLGQADGWHGWRVRQTAGGWEAERVDGERITVPKGVGQPCAAIRLPGDERSRPVVATNSIGLGLLDPDGAEIGMVNTYLYRQTMAAGTDLVPPLPWWHCLRPRDEAGSLALRSVSREQVATLLARACAEHAEEQPPASTLPELLGTVLPQVTHPRLAAGVLGVVRYAALLSAELAVYTDIADGAVALRQETAPSAEPALPDETVASALDWMRTHDFLHQANSSGPTTLPALIAGLASAARTRTDGGDVDGIRLPDTAARHQWHEVIPVLPSLAYMAASALTTDADRAAQLAALDALTNDVFADDGRWRCVIVGSPDPGKGRQWSCSELTMTPHGFLLLVSGVDRNRWRAVQYTARAGDFTLPAGWTAGDATPWEGVVDRAWLARFRATLAERGPVPWRGELADDLVERTGMGHGEAVLLLAGMPYVGRVREHNYLPGELRTTLGLKVPEAETARVRLAQLRWSGHWMVAAAMPADPADLWTTGPDIAGLAAAWLTWTPRSAPVPDELLAAAPTRFHGSDVLDVVSGLANPNSARWLNTDARMHIAPNDVPGTGHTIRAADKSGFRSQHFIGLPTLLTLLAYVLPVGDPIRGHLVDVHDRAVRRSSHPEFLVELAHLSHTDDLRAVLGIAPLEPNQVVVANEWLVVMADPNLSWQVILRPAGLRPEHRTLLDGVVGAMSIFNQLAYEAVLAYQNPAVRAACAARPPEGTDPACYFQDPTVSAPALVGAAAQRFGISTDAATLYLQLLALADPTDADVARWTGWKPARLKAARAELTATDLVLTAKRARAGRSLFLPGGWLTLKNDHLPMEEWKKPMFRFNSAGTPIGPLVPYRPMADHFALAWQRVVDGDAPGYTELRTGRRK